MSKNLDKVAVHSRGYVLVAALLMLAVLALASIVNVGAAQIILLVGFMVAVLAIIVVLYLTTRASTGTGENVDHLTLSRALDEINGTWWQLVVNENTPGLSLISIQMSVLPNHHRLSGTKFSEIGKQVATWNTRAAGIASLDPVEIFYYWQGSYSGRPGSVSGVGVFQFPGDGNATGTGWFTTGNVEQGDFSISSKVHLRRATREEEAIVRSGSPEAKDLLVSCYSAWRTRLDI